MKACFKCGEVKPLSGFYRHPQMADGRLSKCKECTKKDVAERIARLKEDPRWLEKERARCRVKQKRNWRKNPERSRENQRLWRERSGYIQKRDPAKRHVYAIVQYAVRRGKLTRQPCQVCGAKAHAHHPDYDKPLEVIWLCPEHHGEQHRKAA